MPPPLPAPDGPPGRPERPLPALLRTARDEPGYRVLGVLGRGATSTVYEAVDRALGLRVALKVLDGALATTNADAVERFEHEARMLARLDHPGLVRPLRLGRLDDGPAPFLALELLRGPSLRATLRREGALGLEDTEQVMLALLDALAAVHESGVVHRDVKPENVVLVAGTKGPSPRLVDFGAACLVDAPSERIFVGTFDYAAPEQLAGARVGPAADLHACGILLCELVTGRRPRRFDPKRDEVHARLRAGLGAPSVDALRRLGLPTALSELVHETLADDAARRPADAAELARRVAHAMRSTRGRRRATTTRPALVLPWAAAPPPRLSAEDLEAPTRGAPPSPALAAHRDAPRALPGSTLVLPPRPDGVGDVPRASPRRGAVPAARARIGVVVAIAAIAVGAAGFALARAPRDAGRSPGAPEPGTLLGSPRSEPPHE